jgi:uncharacterized Fe-S center protein
MGQGQVTAGARPRVFFTSARVTKWNYASSLPGRLEALLGHAALKDRYEDGEWVAVKTHFGSFGAHRIVRPVFLRKVTGAIKACGAIPFVTDTVRIKGLEYLEVANANGINHLSVGAPVILADGLYGNDSILVEAPGGLGEVAVASAVHDAPAMVVVSHVKGHINSGYAGAIKNMAMGGISGSHRKCGWKCGRGSMHAIGNGALEWDAGRCEFCYQCQEVCPLECISFGQGKEFSYDDGKCWRCGRCVRVCPEDAMEFEGADETEFMRSLARAASAVAGTFEKGKLLYLNFLLDIQPECDCMPGADVPVLQDQGILLSEDMVAVEQASADILKRADPLPDSAASDCGAEEGDDVLLRLNQRDYELQMEEAEALGLGSRRYELIEI